IVIALGLFGVLITMYNWWANTVREAHTGYHTPVVQLHLRYGMILFIASEVMFFLAWFWAFFDSSLFPSAVDAVGGHWPPKGIEVLNPWGFPLLNTLILLCSGTTVTWAHHSLIHGDRHGLKLGLLLTILLGVLFTSISASKRPPGTGISSMSCGCSCSPRFMCGAAGARRSTASGTGHEAVIRRLPLIPTIIVAAAVAIMIGLGVWQLQRARWKEGLL